MGNTVYRCKFESCAYTAAQYAQCCMHIRRKHLGVCIKCHLCDRRSYRLVDIQKHMNTVHLNAESEWFEPIPDLEGDIIEINEDTFHANIALVKCEPTADEE